MRDPIKNTTPFPQEEDAEDFGTLTHFRVGLDDETVATLMELSEATHCVPCTLIASLIRGLLVDDIDVHGGATGIHAGDSHKRLN